MHLESARKSGTFKGWVTETRGFHTVVRGTMFVRDGAVTPGPSRECNITFFGMGRPKSAQQLLDSTVAVRRVQSITVPSSMSFPGLRSPPLKKCPRKGPLGSRFPQDSAVAPREIVTLCD